MKSLFKQKGRWATINLDSGKRIVGKITGVHLDYLELERNKKSTYLDYSKMEYVTFHVDDPGKVDSSKLKGAFATTERKEPAGGDF